MGADQRSRMARRARHESGANAGRQPRTTIRLSSAGRAREKAVTEGRSACSDFSSAGFLKSDRRTLRPLTGASPEQFLLEETGFKVPVSKPGEVERRFPKSGWRQESTPRVKIRKIGARQEGLKGSISRARTVRNKYTYHNTPRHTQHNKNTQCTTPLLTHSPNVYLTQCDYCPVFRMSDGRKFDHAVVTSGVTLTLSRRRGDSWNKFFFASEAFG